MAEVTLGEFIERERDYLAQFKQWWLQQHLKDPTNFPLEMKEGDWVEQKAMFVDALIQNREAPP